jgi:hypothetical protein
LLIAKRIPCYLIDGLPWGKGAGIMGPGSSAS